MIVVYCKPLSIILLAANSTDAILLKQRMFVPVPSCSKSCEIPDDSGFSRTLLIILPPFISLATTLFGVFRVILPSFGSFD